MENVFNYEVAKPYLYFSDDIVIEVSIEFLEITGFTIDELLGKSLIDIGVLLKINSQIKLQDIRKSYSAHIFTKQLNALYMNIILLDGAQVNEKKYTFVEKLNSRLQDKLTFVEQIFTDNKLGASIYSVPGLILLKANQKYLDFLEAPFNKEGNSIGKSIGEIIKGFACSKVEVIFSNVIKSQKTYYTKGLEFKELQGGVTSWDSTKMPIFENGEMKYILETIPVAADEKNDNKSLAIKNNIIIDQKQQLEEKNMQLVSIIENLSEGVMFADSKGDFIMVNSEAKRLIYQSHTGANIRDALKDTEVFDMMGNEIGFNDFPSVRALRGEKSKNVQIFVRHPNKEYFAEISSIPIYNVNGDLTMIVSCFHDITETINQSRKIEEAIIGRYEFLNRVINTFDLPVVRISCPDLKIVYINEKAFSIIKLLRPDVKSINQIKYNEIEDLFKLFKISGYYKCVSEVLKEKKIKYLNKRRLILNGSEVYWNIVFEPVFEVNGEIREILILVIDVTNEIKSNIVMESALKLQGEFLVNISHELKTPLNVIFATAQLFTLYCNSGSLDLKKDSIIKYIESIKQNSYRLSKIINNIVDLSKIEAGFFKLNLSNNNIVEIVEKIVMSVTTLIESKGLNIIFDTDTEENIIACDIEKIERIVLNLISNAIKFSEVGGEIFVDVKDKNEFVEISVKDNGIGIEEKYLDMIFDRFKQVDKSLSRNAEGTGIGLSLVKSIVELHGGNIFVESEFGYGSKFIVRLPKVKVLHENMLYNSNVRSRDENIQVELSDVYS